MFYRVITGRTIFGMTREGKRLKLLAIIKREGGGETMGDLYSFYVPFLVLSCLVLILKYRMTK
jgi:hypothetical protein